MSESFFDLLLANFNLNTTELNIFIKTAPYRYKKYEIPKRKGGTRTIAQPTKALKIVQRWYYPDF